MDMALAMLLTIALIIVPLGTAGVHLMRYTDIQSARLEAYSRLQTIADVVVAYGDNTFTTQNATGTYAIEYTTTTATISPRIKLHADHIDYNGRTYDVAWWEIWIQDAYSRWLGTLVMSPPNGTP